MPEIHWELFVVLVFENKENINSPLYRVLVDHFPVEYMEKLLSIAISGSSKVIRNYAALLLTYHFCDIMEERYSSIDSHSLRAFQSSAIHFLVSDQLGPYVDKGGKVMVSKLLSLSLQNNQEWSEFVDLTTEAFTSCSHSLDAVLDIFCGLHVLFQCKFIELLEPQFRKKAAYLTSLLELLGRGDDHRPFMILPSISHMLKREIWSTLMEGAIMSPFFDKTTNPHRRYLVASSLRFCIEHSSFHFSSTMATKVLGIMFLLIQSSDAGEKRMAAALCGALLASCFQEMLKQFSTQLSR